MTKRLYQCIVLLLLTFQLNCSAVKLNPQFWEQLKSKTFSVVIIPSPIEGSTYRISGLLPIATYREVNYLDKGLTNYVKKDNYSKFEVIKKDFTDELTRRGVNILPLDDVLFTERLSQLIETGKIKQQAYAELRKNVNADFLILLYINKCGIDEFYNYIAPPRYYSVVEVKAQLLDMRSEKVEWRCEKLVLKRIESDWDQPPDYPNVAQAFVEVLEKEKALLHDAFFNMKQ